jgi:hypothetical protein
MDRLPIGARVAIVQALKMRIELAASRFAA